MSNFVQDLLGGSDNIPDYSGEIREQLTPGSFNEEAGYLKRYFEMPAWSYLIVFLIASTGLAAVINTYNAISGINKKKEECEKTVLKNYTLTKFIIMMTLSLFVVALGVLLMIFFRKKENQRRMTSLGIIVAGVFGIFYSLSLQFQDLTKNSVLYTSWVLFILSLGLGWFLSGKTGVKFKAPKFKYD